MIRVAVTAVLALASGCTVMGAYVGHRLDAKDARTMALLEKVVGAAKDAETQARGALRDVAETTKDMAKTAVASLAQVAAAAARGCLGCGASLAPTARFCGVCGTTVA